MHSCFGIGYGSIASGRCRVSSQLPLPVFVGRVLTLLRVVRAGTMSTAVWAGRVSSQQWVQDCIDPVLVCGAVPLALEQRTLGAAVCSRTGLLTADLHVLQLLMISCVQLDLGWHPDYQGSYTAVSQPASLLCSMIACFLIHGLTTQLATSS